MDQVSSSYYSHTGDDSYKHPGKLSKEKLPINKTPVLYLRKSRNLHYPAEVSKIRDRFMYSGQSNWFVDTGLNLDGSTIDENYQVDRGDLYPNHSSTARVGQPEWVKFRDYKRNNLYYLEQEEIVID